MSGQIAGLRSNRQLRVEYQDEGVYDTVNVDQHKRNGFFDSVSPASYYKDRAPFGRSVVNLTVNTAQDAAPAKQSGSGSTPNNHDQRDHSPKVRRIVCLEDGSGYPDKSIPVDDEEAYNRYQPHLRHNCVLEVRRIIRTRTGFRYFAYNQQVNGPKPEDLDFVRLESITILSPLLLKTVRSVVKYWPNGSFDENHNQITLAKPYRAIGAHRRDFDALMEDLEKRLRDSPPDPQEPPQIIEELRLLLGEVDKAQKNLITEELVRHGMDPPKATFEMLWMLFKPGDLVYFTVQGSLIAGMVRFVYWERDDIEGSNPHNHKQVEMHVWYLDHDGKSQRPCRCAFNV